MKENNINAFQKLVDDDGKLYQRYLNKKVNASKEGLSCMLSFEEYCKLVYEANIVSSQLGFTGEMYVLARYNDQGDYSYDNCRFITQKENISERRLTNEGRTKLIANAMHMNEVISTLYSKEEMSNKIKNGMKNSEYFAKRKRRSEERLAELDRQKDKRYCKEHNSQYGTFWITNGETNMKWSLSKGELPSGFYKGRVCKSKIS